MGQVGDPKLLTEALIPRLMILKLVNPSADNVAPPRGWRQVSLLEEGPEAMPRFKFNGTLIMDTT